MLFPSLILSLPLTQSYALDDDDASWTLSDATSVTDDSDMGSITEEGGDNDIQDDNGTCPICYTRDGDKKIPCCGGTLCGTCLAIVNIYNPVCPFCRAEIE